MSGRTQACIAGGLGIVFGCILVGDLYLLVIVPKLTSAWAGGRVQLTKPERVLAGLSAFARSGGIPLLTFLVVRIVAFFTLFLSTVLTCIPCSDAVPGLLLPRFLS